jgi:hypothetical protein
LPNENEKMKIKGIFDALKKCLDFFIRCCCTHRSNRGGLALSISDHMCQRVGGPLFLGERVGGVLFSDQ